MIVARDGIEPVKAFNVDHGSPKNAFGYRFETSLAISGDANRQQRSRQRGQPKAELLHLFAGTAV
jgi:hypothetical protein